MTDTSGDVKKRILSILKKESMSISKLSRKLKLRTGFVAGYLEAMRHDGELELVTIGRSKVYRPKRKSKR